MTIQQALQLQLYICIDGYEGFLFSNQENVRTSPLGDVADFQIVKAPAAFKREVNKWLSLPVRLMQIV
jgi:hypothetical protein